MSDFARLLEMARAADAGAAMQALGEPPAEDAKDAPRRPTVTPEAAPHPAPAAAPKR